MDEILTRIDSAEKQISLIKNKVAYRDLRRMLATIDSIVSDISRESVECRRTKKNTPKYNELVANANSMLDNLEQHITFAALIS